MDQLKKPKMCDEAVMEVTAYFCIVNDKRRCS